MYLWQFRIFVAQLGQWGFDWERLPAEEIPDIIAAFSEYFS